MTGQVITWREAQELAKGADHRVIHRGSIYGLPPPHRKTPREAKWWIASVRAARRKPVSVKASGRATPPITANVEKLAGYLAYLAPLQDNCLFSYAKLAEELNMGVTTVQRAVTALKDRGLLKVWRRQKRAWNGFQMHRVQARNDYEIIVTRNAP